MNQESDKQINLGLIILTIKINALISSLSSEQKVLYKHSIESSKEIILSLLDNPLSQKEVDEALKALEI
ncbi:MULTISPECIES: hypothetical protein [Chryseobacterium]|uniref:hypothetical protein n=1 Tax=Chryseobacterium TaxID=59732 RepID=UPI000D5798B6|nr:MULTISPECIES: hypothetical protein [Chryseobacterium]PVV55792.1 hypothetical protein DD829_13160 [Chryseobacterium sp. HMWF035]WBX95743.1 hypothetical protein PE065_12765 [Chryseobacterium gambrini]